MRLKRRMQAHTGEQQRAGRFRPSALHARRRVRRRRVFAHRQRSAPKPKRRRPRAQVVGGRTRTWRARESARAQSAQACSCPPHELANPAGTDASSLGATAHRILGWEYSTRKRQSVQFLRSVQAPVIPCSPPTRTLGGCLDVFEWQNFCANLLFQIFWHLNFISWCLDAC